MKALLDVQMWRDAVGQSLTALSTTVAAFAAKLVLALLILAVGWVVARLVQAVSGRALARLGADRLLRRAGVSDPLQKAGFTRPFSEILARFLFWIIILTFMLIAVDALELRAITDTIHRLLAYVPRIAGAAVIVLVGLLLGRMVHSVVVSGAALASATQAMRLAGMTHAGVVAVACMLAVEQLGVETEILAAVLTAVVAAFGLSMGVAFALGARGVVAHVLAGHFLRQRFSSGQEVEVDGQVGVIARVGTVDTLLEHAGGTLSFPNGRLLELTANHRADAEME